jgi:chemotaxis family two-component system sensor histidine kinase/response regulator PixL
MSINPEIRDQAYQFFVEEATELLEAIESGLLTLKEERTTPKVHHLMRAAHSIKGGAASVDLQAIKTIAHKLEDIFKALYSDDVIFDTELETLILEAFDCLRSPLMEQITAGRFDEENALLAFEPIYEQIEIKLGSALKEADNYIPTSSDLGIDIVASIFEVDVAQGLERLALALKNPQDHEVAGELRAQIDVFAGFAELLNLPGFGEIVQISLQALESRPEKVLDIIALTIADCTAAREAVLAGDRDRGGNPSPEWLSLLDGATSPSTNLDTIVETDDLPTEVFNNFNNNVFNSLSPEEINFLQSDPDTEILLPPSLDDVFGSVVEEINSTPQLEKLDLNIEEMPSLEDVFGDTQTDLTNTKELTSDTSLDDVFGESVELDNLSANSLEELFGALPENSNWAISSTPTNLPPAPANLDAAIESIGDIFDQLPSASDTSSITARPKTRDLTVKKTQDSIKPALSSNRSNDNLAVTNLSVRVDLNRLEKMDNVVGELVINRNSLSLQNEQLQGTVRELLLRFGKFQEMTGKLRELSDRLLIEPSKSQLDRQLSTNYPLTNDSEFDSLEMDRYNELYYLLQGVLEEVVQLEEGVDDIALFARQSNRTIDQQRQMLNQMRDELMWARMLPLSQILQRFPRVLRDLATTYNKPVNLQMTGTSVLVDKAVLEKLYDPLLHLLRNAFDHGIEPPDVRYQQGKPAEGSIEIVAYYLGNQTIVELKDDGQGIDFKKIARKAIEKGLLTPEEMANATKEKLLDLIFEPGFSTAATVSEISGRGVGLNVVRSQIESLKGTVTITSNPGEGSIFTLRLPLTLTIAKLLVCSIGTTPIALPSDSIEEIIIPESDKIKLSGKQRLLYWREQIIPIYRLVDLLEYNCPIPNNILSKSLETVPSPADWALPLLLLRRDREFVALEIERLITEQELVIKPFGNAISPPGYTYGCTILGDGTLIPVINGAVLIEEFTGQIDNINTARDNFDLHDLIGETARIDSLSSQVPQNLKNYTLLIVDDSAALRRTLALSLEKQGYQVLQARDGKEALEQLQTNPYVDLVICDIEMPNMNGFEFLSVRRQNPQISKIPVAMLTSRSNEKHRNLAKQLGANEYFTKPYIEQQFLVSIKNLLQHNISETIVN